MVFTLKRNGYWLFGVLILLVAGCAAPLKQGIYLDPGFEPTAIDEITLLPAQDLRIDRAIEVNMEKQIRVYGMKMLKKKGYRVRLDDNIGDVAEITEDDLKSGDPKWISRLGPPDARWVMVLTLIDVTTKFAFGSTGNAELTGFLFDKESATIAWWDKGIGRAGQGGCIGCLLKFNMDEQAIGIAVYNLFASIPKRAK
jgi:hypothetical protein